MTASGRFEPMLSSPVNGAPDVSVVISTFNRCMSLAATLEALRRQITPGLDFEVIVVDNNSNDHTREIVKRFQADEPHRFRYIFEQQQGVSYGRNAGIRASRASIVAFTDDDNCAEAGWVARLKAALDRHPEVAGVGGRILPVWAAARPLWLDERHWSPLAILDYGERPFYTSAADPRCLLTANLAVRRGVLSAIGGFAPDFPRCQDHELLVRLWRSGALVLYAPDLVVRARITPERLTRGYHRAWHAEHGQFMALLQLQEIIDPNGHLLKAPGDAPRLYGSPGFVYRQLFHEGKQWLAATLRRHPSDTFSHSNRVRYLVSYIRRRAALDRLGTAQRVHQVLTFVRAHFEKHTRQFGMPGRRLVTVHFLLAILVGGSAYDILRAREHWPFSPYAMFAAAERAPTLDALRLMGVTSETPAREIPLLEEGMIEPFDQARLPTALARIYDNPDRRPLIQQALRDCLDRYENLRVTGHHHGPPLRAVRLYQAHWALDPQGRNRDVPDTKRLLEEVDGPRIAPRGLR
jgi:glycosyltransferase involved in cell wall biosynthesis